MSVKGAAPIKYGPHRAGLIMGFDDGGKLC